MDGWQSFQHVLNLQGIGVCMCLYVCVRSQNTAEVMTNGLHLPYGARYRCRKEVSEIEDDDDEDDDRFVDVVALRGEREREERQKG